MYPRTIRAEQEFVWRPTTSWRQHIIRLVVVGVAVTVFVWSTPLPINTVTTRGAAMPDPASKQSTENSVLPTISPQTPARFDERPDVVESSQAIGEVRRPTPWVIRAQ
jgi:hypothetical protein